MANTIKILDNDVVKVYFGVSDNVKIYLGTVKVYPKDEPSFNGKYWFTLSDGTIVSAECDSSSAITTADTSSYKRSIVQAEIGNCITSIGINAFSGCTNLTSVTIPNSVTSIGQAAFSNCSGLTSVIIPNSVTSIGEDAFFGSSGLTSIVIPDSTTTIGTSAFTNCSSISSIVIGENVTSIESSAFSSCSALTSITSLASTAPTIKSTTYQNVKTSGTLYVPSGTSGYDAWMSTNNYYLGKYNWTMVEQ